MFKQFDKDGNGTISFDEFLIALRVSVHATIKWLRLVCLPDCATAGAMLLPAATNESVKV